MHPINAVYFYSCRTFHGLFVFVCRAYGWVLPSRRDAVRKSRLMWSQGTMGCTPANTIERPVRGGDAAFCTITLATCYVLVSQQRATNQITIGIRLVQKKYKYDEGRIDVRKWCWNSMYRVVCRNAVEHRCISVIQTDHEMSDYRKTCIIVNRIVLFLCSAALVLSSTPRHTD